MLVRIILLQSILFCIFTISGYYAKPYLKIFWHDSKQLAVDILPQSALNVLLPPHILETLPPVSEDVVPFMDMIRGIEVNDILPQSIRYLTSATDSLAASTGPDSPAFAPAKSPGESSTDPTASTAGSPGSQDSPKLPKESQNPATATSETPLLDRMVRIANMFNVDSYFGIEDFSISEYLEKPEKPAKDSQDTETPPAESTDSSTLLDSIVKNINSYFGINESPASGNPSGPEEESITMEEKLTTMEEIAAHLQENQSEDNGGHCLAIEPTDLCCWDKEGEFMGKEGAEEGLEEFCQQRRVGMLEEAKGQVVDEMPTRDKLWSLLGEKEAEGQVVDEMTTKDKPWSLLGEKEDISGGVKEEEGNMKNEL
jgi:hypothetical protein